MKYYIFIQNEKLNGCGQCRQLTEGVINLEVEESVYNAYAENPDMYVWDGQAIVVDPKWEEKQIQKEAERIAELSLTKREVFLALYRDLGITPEEIRARISDTLALIEFDYANEYYRGNPLIDLIGKSLGYTKEQLDYLFLNKEFPSQKEVVDD